MANKLNLSHPPPSQTGLHHLSQCCLGCLDQGLSYPVQLSYTVPPFKILERYWLEGRLRRPSSSDLGMHLLSNLGRKTRLIACSNTECYTNYTNIELKVNSSKSLNPCARQLKVVLKLIRTPSQKCFHAAKG